LSKFSSRISALGISKHPLGDTFGDQKNGSIPKCFCNNWVCNGASLTVGSFVD